MKRLILLLVLLPSFVQAEDGESKIEFLRMSYSEFLGIESFGEIRVIFEGEDAEKIGLDEDELSDFLRLKFKNNFAGIPYKEEPDESFEILLDEERQSKIGSFVVTVWIVGTDQPIVYHMTATVDSWEFEGGFESTVLGYGNKATVPETIRTTITEMVEKAAIMFFKVRGEL
jgi:hypothetical protein